jgi:hypothetical protein
MKSSVSSNNNEQIALYSLQQPQMSLHPHHQVKVPPPKIHPRHSICQHAPTNGQTVVLNQNGAGLVMRRHLGLSFMHGNDDCIIMEPHQS